MNPAMTTLVPAGTVTFTVFSCSSVTYQSLLMKIRLGVLCIIGLFIHAGLMAQPAWSWAQQAVSANTDYGRNMAKDVSGNVYVCGTFSATVTFGAVTLSGSGTNCMFLVKYDVAGNVVWAKTAIASGATYANAVCVDPSGFVYVTGEFSTSIDFGGVLITGSPGDVFLVKYDAAGNPIWAQRAGGTNAEQGYAVAADLFGNVFITGYYKSGVCTFGTFTLANTNGSSSDLFIAKYDSSGTVLWAYRAGGNVYDMGNSITTDAAGSVYFTGFFASTNIVFGSFGLMNSGPSATSDIFVAKYDSTGNVRWAVSFGGASGDEEAFGITTDSGDHIYVTGTFSSTSLQMGSTNLQNTDGNIFIAKLDTAGVVNWALNGGGTNGFLYRNSIASDSSGDVYVAGSFSNDTAFFSGDTLLNTDVTGASRDFFVVKCNPAGQVDWTVTGGGTLSDDAYGVVAMGNDNFVTMGAFASAAMTIGTTTLNNSGLYDFFITNAGSSPLIVQDQSNTGTTSIFPNPCSGWATLQVDAALLLDKPVLNVYDMLGNLVLTSQLNSIETQIDLSGLAPAVYSYTISGPHDTAAHGKLVRQ